MIRHTSQPIASCSITVAIPFRMRAANTSTKSRWRKAAQPVVVPASDDSDGSVSLEDAANDVPAGYDARRSVWRVPSPFKPWRIASARAIEKSRVF